MQIRFVGFQHVQSGEHMGAMGVFLLMQVSSLSTHLFLLPVEVSFGFSLFMFNPSFSF